MRAHFASDVPVSLEIDDGLQQQGSHNTKEPQYQVPGNINQNSLQERILEFKSDSSKMAVVGEFIDNVLQKAEEEANKQCNNKNKDLQQGKNKTQKQTFATPDFKNGKVVNRARGFVVKLFESICNCANNAAGVPVSRFKFRGGKRASATENNSKMATNKTEEKPRKNEKAKTDDANEVQEVIELQ